MSTDTATSMQIQDDKLLTTSKIPEPQQGFQFLLLHLYTRFPRLQPSTQLLKGTHILSTYYSFFP